MSLRQIVNSVYRKLGPDVVVDELNRTNRTIEIKEKYLFSHITEAYYILRGCEVKW